MEEFSHPLVEVDHPVYQSGLRLENIHTAIIPCPFAEEFKTHRQQSDSRMITFRPSEVGMKASSLEPLMIPVLQRKNDLIESFYGTYHQRVLEEPEGHGMDYVHAYMSIRKI